jgi:hypothetical protein
MGLFRKRSSADEAEAGSQAVQAPPGGDPGAARAVESDQPPEPGAVESEQPPEPPLANDQGLPGTAGYRHRTKSDVMPARFTFVRPDGQPTGRRRRSFFGRWREM